MVRLDHQVIGFTCCCPFLQVPLKSRSWCISWTEMLLLDSPFPPHWKPTRPIPWSTMWWESMWDLKTQCLLVWKWIMRCEELDLPLLSFELCCSYSVAHLSSGNIGCFCCLRQFSFFTSLLAFCLAFSQNGQVSSVLLILFAFQLKICLFSSSELLLCSFQQVFWPSFCCYSKLFCHASALLLLLILFLKGVSMCSVLGSRQWSDWRSCSQHTTDIDVLWIGLGFEPCCQEIQWTPGRAWQLPHNRYCPQGYFRISLLGSHSPGKQN